MKKTELVRKLKAMGANLFREGKGHEVWESKSGYMFTVPRHKEIGEILAREILKQAEK